MEETWAWGDDNTQFAAQLPISFDCEFVSNKFYYPKLALLQLHQDGNKKAVLFDPLQRNCNLPWEKLTAHPAPLVLHAGTHDLEIMLLNGAKLPQKILDTQIGFALCFPQMSIGYAEMVAHFLAHQLNKSATRSNWLKRPLSKQQLSYAADDVFYLSKVFPLMCEKLKSLGRMSWWNEESQTLLQRVTKTKKPYSWYRLKGAQQLRNNEINIAQYLVVAREKFAICNNLPRRNVVSDNEIIRLAKLQLSTVNNIKAYLPSNHPLLRAIPLLKNELPAIKKDKTLFNYYDCNKKLSAQQQKKLNQLKNKVNNLAIELNINANMLATSKAMYSYCLDSSKPNILKTGWRFSCMQQILESLY